MKNSKSRLDQYFYQKKNKRAIVFYDRISTRMRLVEQIIYNINTGSVCVNCYFQSYLKQIKTIPNTIDDNGNYWYKKKKGGD